MTLRPLSDVSPARWFVDADASWWTKVCLGPPGFEAYARVLFDLSDDPPDGSGDRLVADLADTVAHHTSVPDDCVFGQWTGCGWEPPIAPALARLALNGEVAPGVVDVVRDYHLFSGGVADLLLWRGSDPPHIAWPADHAWFIAADVDPDWIGVAGSQTLIDEVLAHPGLDAKRSSYDATDWERP